MVSSNSFKFIQNGETITFEFQSANLSNYEILEYENSYSNYIKGRNSSNWVSGIKNAKRLKFKNIYPGIDLILYHDNNFPRYDFYVHPNSDPNQIKIMIDGAKIESSSANKINLISENGNIIHSDLKVLQSNNRVEANFNFSKKSIRFDIGEYKSDELLIIDPLIYSSFIGGLQNDFGQDIVKDHQGNIIICGYTNSFNFPTTVNAYQEDLSDDDDLDEVFNPDCFVSKFSPEFEHIFTSFIGGEGSDFARGVDVGPNGEIFLTGHTQEPDSFPTTGGVYERRSSGAIDAYVLKLSSDGRSLIWSTLIGGSSDDFSQDIAVDPFGVPTITGYTNIDTRIRYPITPGTIGDQIEGQIDGFVTRFDENGERLLWSYYIGGQFDDFPQRLVLDSLENVLITGTTRSNNFKTSPGALDREYNDIPGDPSFGDAFYMKIRGDAKDVLYSTFLGGSKKDNAYGIAIDDQGYVYIAGATESFDFPVTSNAFRKELNNGNPFAGEADAFVAKIDWEGDSLVLSSYLGGDKVDRAFAVDVDENFDIYLTGTTNSYDFPTSALAYDRSFNDSAFFSDVFVTKLKSRGDTLGYSTYLGGEFSDVGSGIAVLNESNVVVTGATNSFKFPTTNDALQAGHQDSLKSDVFFAQVLMDDFSDSDYIICDGGSIQIESGISSDTETLFFEWTPEINIDDPNSEFPIVNPEYSTKYTCVVTDQFGNKRVSIVFVSVVNGVELEISGERGVPNGLVRIYRVPYTFNSSYEWEVEGGDLVTGQGSNQVGVKWTDADNGKVIVTETNEFGCFGSDTLTTFFVSTWEMDIVPFGDYSLCDGDTIVYDAGEEYKNVVWNRGTLGRYDTVYTNGLYYFNAIDENGNSYQSETAEVTFLPKPSPPKIVYKADSLYFLCLTAGTAWQWYKDGIPIIGENERIFRTIIDGEYFIEITNRFGCRNISEVIILSDVEDELINEIQIYPNPAGNNIIITNVQLTYRTIEIYDILGNLVLSEKIITRSEEIKIDIQSLAPGAYYLLIGKQVKQFIKE